MFCVVEPSHAVGALHLEPAFCVPSIVRPHCILCTLNCRAALLNTTVLLDLYAKLLLIIVVHTIITINQISLLHRRGWGPPAQLLFEEIMFTHF
jgi:hypothetical protein